MLSIEKNMKQHHQEIIRKLSLCAFYHGKNESVFLVMKHVCIYYLKHVVLNIVYVVEW